MAEKIVKSEAAWREQLTRKQFDICRRKGTERAFTGPYNNEKRAGTYTCVCCGAPLFKSTEKYDSGSGWPSFWQPADQQAVETEQDASHFMVRTEVHCAKCDSHLGHVFEDGPQPTGLRYCINSVSLKLEPDD